MEARAELVTVLARLRAEQPGAVPSCLQADLTFGSGRDDSLHRRTPILPLTVIP